MQAAVLKPVRTHENNRFLHAWSMREISIAVRLAVFRRQKVSFIPPHEISLPDSDEGWQIVRRMTTAAHPAEAELILDKSRWEYLEELEQGHFFELDNLLAYYLKLQILERRFSMTEEKGRKEYEIIIDRQKKQFSDVRLSGTK
ncbi:MAG: DUF2764 family protein [Spirochaetales bacterium]|nr:DUF2764 family protein [Spirochaetales bacterium]